jgi:hypothetical protein
MPRQTRQTRRAWLGAALIAGLIACGVLVFLLDDLFALFERRYTVVVVMDRAPGLIEGSPVWVGGKHVGRVRSVGFLPGTDSLVRVAVTIELPRAMQTQVRADSRARLTTERFVGEQVVDLEPGTAAAPTLMEGDTLRMQLRPSAAELAADAAATRALLDSTLHVVRQIAPTFRARLEDAQQALQAMQLAMAEAGALERNMTGGAAAQFMRNPAFITSLQRSREHAAALSLLLRERTRDDALQSDVTAGLRRLQSRADSLTALLDSAAQSLSGGLLVRAQRDSALVHAVFRARAQLDSLIAETKRNPLRFFF